MRSPTLRTRLTTLGATLLGVLVAGSAQAQHAGDIGLRVDDQQLEVFGPLGAGEDTEGVFLATFGDTGFPGYTSNPGFDALAGTLPQGRVGFAFLAGMSRWDPAESIWLEPAEVGERMRVSFITLQTIIEDEPIIGFDLAVQPALKPARPCRGAEEAKLPVGAAGGEKPASGKTKRDGRDNTPVLDRALLQTRIWARLCGHNAQGVVPTTKRHEVPLRAECDGAGIERDLALDRARFAD